MENKMTELDLAIARCLVDTMGRKGIHCMVMLDDGFDVYSFSTGKEGLDSLEVLHDWFAKMTYHIQNSELTGPEDE